MNETPRAFDASRAATVRDLRALADRLEALPMDDAAEALTWLGPHLDRLRREAEMILPARR